MYRLDEPWDGPNNSKLHNVENPIYRCASDPSPQIYTSYVSIQGSNTLFPDKGTCSLSSIQDKLSNTILLLEMHNSGIHWMEPKDLSVDEAINGITRKSLPYVTGRYRKGNQGTLAIFADGRIRTINSDIDPKVLRSLIEIDTPDKSSQPYIN
ncbi:MAG: hypothetical protein KDA68_17060 [Planctomycetaceae bacterium]|nr:hypothetical protein [Planctomycetaceae bacterium]